MTVQKKKERKKRQHYSLDKKPVFSVMGLMFMQIYAYYQTIKFMKLKIRKYNTCLLNGNEFSL